MKGNIFEIKRFAVHDGDGIRTTVFLKGCPLKCVWCHNPEGIAIKPQLAYYENKCIGCGECVRVCPVKAHSMSVTGDTASGCGNEAWAAVGDGGASSYGQEDTVHAFNREKCIGCGACEKVCLGDALKLYGREVSVAELLPVLLEDKEFFENSGGGVTLSGGECLMQADFCAELLKALKEQGVHTAVDTCGFVSKAAFDKVMPYTDIFLYDLKAYEEEVHIKCTGQSNKLILENLRYIDACGKDIEVRIPYVPEYNGDQIDNLGAVLCEFQHLVGVRVLSYHNYAGSKYRALNMPCTLPEVLPLKGETEEAARRLRALGIVVLG